MRPASAPGGGGTNTATIAYTDAAILLHRGDAPGLIVIPLADLLPSVTTTPTTFGDVPYRAFAIGASVWFQREVPQSWAPGTCTVSALLAKNFNADGTALLTASSLSDPSNQLSSGDAPGTPSSHINTTWTVPPGSSAQIQHTFIEVPVATLQIFESNPIATWCNFVIDYPGGGTFGAHSIAIAGATLRRSDP